ncbi:hypothetical protein MUG91_G144n119 [Manis pentadactyla]|nr:hypothetical protein MUG91_G144n119 [Manis pentadactyla]
MILNSPVKTSSEGRERMEEPLYLLQIALYYHLESCSQGSVLDKEGSGGMERSLHAEQDGHPEVNLEAELGVPAALEKVPSPQRKALEAQLVAPAGLQVVLPPLENKLGSPAGMKILSH